MKRIVHLLLALAAGLTATSAAQATTITFGTFNGPDNSEHIGTSYTESGYQFTNADLFRWRDGSSADADPTSSTGMATGIPNTTTTMTRIGGGAFNLTSIDVDDIFRGSFRGPLNYTYTMAGGGTGSGSFLAGGTSGYATLLLNLANLISFAFTPGPDLGFVQFDNVVVTDAGNVTVTPLPAALPLFGAAIASTGLMAARRRRKVSARIA